MLTLFVGSPRQNGGPSISSRPREEFYEEK
jgi:hypothetical protein